MEHTAPATVDATPTPRKPCLTSILDIDTVTQKPLELACLNIKAPDAQARNAASGETPMVASIGWTNAAEVITPRELEPVITCIKAAITIGTNIPGRLY